MPHSFPHFALGLTLTICGSMEAAERIELEPAVVLDVHSKPGAKSPVRYEGQSAKDGRIDLTATNGFFDRCFQAFDPQPGLASDKPYIAASFDSLGRFGDVAGTARWHLWCAEAGEIKATFYLRTPTGEEGHPWRIKVGDETQTLKANESDGAAPQSQTLTFKIAKQGRVTFTIDCTDALPPAESRLRFIRLEGSAVKHASLLRTRWRPAAVHARFFAPPECPLTKMWVFETRAISAESSYSPLTTPFGYYGTSFEKGGSIAKGGSFNFSMWIAGRTGAEAPPAERVARLIGTDLPAAEYSTFGGEGTGVKFRNAVAYPHGAERSIQSLRMDGREGMLTYYGYFYNEAAARWKLFASAQCPPKKPTAQDAADFGTLRSTGSFCEVPGPPARERSGDIVREIKRRGWFYGADGKWYRAVLGDALKDPPPAEEPDHEPSAPGKPSSKRAFYNDDYATEGWVSMATGGIELYTEYARNRPRANEKPTEIPEYLSADKTAQLLELPVRFGKSQATKITADAAEVEIELLKTGPNSQAVLYFGTVDGVTYPAKEVRAGSKVEIDLFRPERTWQHATPEQAVAVGRNSFALKGLQTDTPYYFRLFVSHDEGQSWAYESGGFRTK